MKTGTKCGIYLCIAAVMVSCGPKEYIPAFAILLVGASLCFTLADLKKE